MKASDWLILYINKAMKKPEIMTPGIDTTAVAMHFYNKYLHYCTTVNTVIKRSHRNTEHFQQVLPKNIQ